MTGAFTQWSIGRDHQVGPSDIDEDGYLAGAALGSWLADAVDAYLAQFEALRRLPANYRVMRRPGRQPRASLLGRPNEVLVTASATEVRASELVVSLRVRPFGGDIDLPLNVTCRVSVEDVDTGEPWTFDDAFRAEVVAVERAADCAS